MKSFQIRARTHASSGALIESFSGYAVCYGEGQREEGKADAEWLISKLADKMTNLSVFFINLCLNLPLIKLI